MNPKPAVWMTTLRWTARTGSIASVFILLLFFIGEGFTPANVGPREWVGLLFFPEGIVIGMALGWWRELIGGSVATASLASFYLVYGLALTGKMPGGLAFLLFGLPGILFLAYGLASYFRQNVVKRHGAV